MISIKAVAGIIFDNDKILVAERPVGKPYSGFWEFPGGKIEAGETGQQAIVRELQEELGIEVLSTEYGFEHSYQYPDKLVFLEIWLIHQFAHLPRPQEGQCLRWVTFAELLTLPLLEGNWPIVEKIKEKVL